MGKKVEERVWREGGGGDGALIPALSPGRIMHEVVDFVRFLRH